MDPEMLPYFVIAEDGRGFYDAEEIYEAGLSRQEEAQLVTRLMNMESDENPKEEMNDYEWGIYNALLLMRGQKLNDYEHQEVDMDKLAKMKAGFSLDMIEAIPVISVRFSFDDFEPEFAEDFFQCLVQKRRTPNFHMLRNVEMMSSNRFAMLPVLTIQTNLTKKSTVDSKELSLWIAASSHMLKEVKDFNDHERWEKMSSLVLLSLIRSSSAENVKILIDRRSLINAEFEAAAYQRLTSRNILKQPSRYLNMTPIEQEVLLDSFLSGFER
jgi:hypothetical protein